MEEVIKLKHFLYYTQKAVDEAFKNTIGSLQKPILLINYETVEKLEFFLFELEKCFAVTNIDVDVKIYITREKLYRDKNYVDFDGKRYFENTSGGKTTFKDYDLTII